MTAMRFRLRTLLIVLALGPPAIAGYVLLCMWFVRAVIPIGDFDLISGPYLSVRKHQISSSDILRPFVPIRGPANHPNDVRP